MKHNAAMLGQFLTSRRRQLVRAHLGLPQIAGRTTRGLRREEVAYLAGVSVTWYTWLEQGRDVTPSRQVVDSLARTLRLSHAEHVYLSALAGHSAPQPAEDPSPGTVPAHVQRLLRRPRGLPGVGDRAGLGHIGMERRIRGAVPERRNSRRGRPQLSMAAFHRPLPARR